MCTDLLNPVAGGDGIRAIVVVERGRLLRQGFAGSFMLWGGRNQEMISSYRIKKVAMHWLTNSKGPSCVSPPFGSVF